MCGPAAAAVTGCPAQAEGVLPLRLPGAAAGGGGRREAGRCLRALAGRWWLSWDCKSWVLGSAAEGRRPPRLSSLVCPVRVLLRVVFFFSNDFVLLFTSFLSLC